MSENGLRAIAAMVFGGFEGEAACPERVARDGAATVQSGCSSLRQKATSLGKSAPPPAANAPPVPRQERAAAETADARADDDDIGIGGRGGTTRRRGARQHERGGGGGDRDHQISGTAGPVGAEPLVRRRRSVRRLQGDSISDSSGVDARV